MFASLNYLRENEYQQGKLKTLSLTAVKVVGKGTGG